MSGGTTKRYLHWVVGLIERSNDLTGKIVLVPVRQRNDIVMS